MSAFGSRWNAASENWGSPEFIKYGSFLFLADFHLPSLPSCLMHLLGIGKRHLLGKEKKMWRQKMTITVAALQLLLALGSAHEHQFFKNTPRANLEAEHVHRRQSTPPGYSPDFGLCGTGTTCQDACGPNWESCQASTTLSLFCYNKVDLKQTCCENGSGRELHQFILCQSPGLTSIK